MSAQLIAIVAESRKGVYCSPDKHHENIALEVDRPEINDIEMPTQALGYNTQLYGIKPTVNYSHRGN